MNTSTNVEVQPQVEIVVSEEKKEYGSKKINEALVFLKKTAGVDDFKENETKQRHFAQHIVKLHEKIGSDDFKERLRGILSDDFKAKNCNSIAYLYRELKGFIHSPIVEPEKKGVRTFTI